MRPKLSSLIARDWARISIGTGLIAIWLLVLSGLSGGLFSQVASWLVFLALLITPGYLLGDLVTRRLHLDSLERLALALPLGMVVLAVPGLLSLLQHRTIGELAGGWMLASGIVVAAWLLHGIWTLVSLARRPSPLPSHSRKGVWSPDELLMLLLLALGFILVVPTLNLPKIDGDAYAVASFSADALAGLPLNAREPLFGTTLGPGVRMVFNQTLPLAYLWSYLSGIDPITLAAVASRSMLALWALFAAYALGRAAIAGDNSRRIGLFTAGITLLIYVAAPFLRGDNVSLFYFERTNADKFLVPVTMLPVAFAMAIRFVREGQWPAWFAAALVALAVSAIHPLPAAMLTVGLVGFAGFHLLLNLRRATAWRRAAAIVGLVAVAMALPMVQLVISRGDAPLAASYPSSFEGWTVGTRWVPVLPVAGASLPTLDYYGPLPNLADVDASQAGLGDAKNPFLIWRFAVNMVRRRLLIFDMPGVAPGEAYISDPSLIYEPPYLLALVVLPLLALWAWRRRQDHAASLGAQFAVGSTAAVLLVMFNPWVTPLIGSLVMPWILWRFIWVLPYALVIALVVAGMLGALARLIARPLRDNPASLAAVQGFAMIGFVIAAGLALSPAIDRNLQDLRDRTASPYSFPTPQGIFDALSKATVDEPATVLADQDLSVTIPAYVANANVVAHRMPTTSEVFPADRQVEALQRLKDQDAFFRSPYLTEQSVDILRRYDVRYVVTSSGSDLDTQLRLAPQWFTWLLDSQSYSLYTVDPARWPAGGSAVTLRGNTALAAQDWTAAEQQYQAALDQARPSTDLLALLGLAEIAHAHGEFDVAAQRLQAAVQQAPAQALPNLHHRLGLLYAERGQLAAAVVEYTQAQALAPQVARFHESLGDACLTQGNSPCADEQYRQAVAARNLANEDERQIALADLWRRRGHTEQALALYEQAAQERPSLFNQLTLLDALLEAGQTDQANALVAWLRNAHPFSAEIAAIQAHLAAVEGQTERAIALFRRAKTLETVQLQDSSRTEMALAQVLLDAHQPEQAEAEIEQVVARQPYDALVHRVQGDYWRSRGQPRNAIASYQRSLELDPTQVDTYIALRNQLRSPAPALADEGGGASAQPEAEAATWAGSEELNRLLEATLARNTGSAAASLAVDLGEQRQRMGDTRGAVAAFQQALLKLDTANATGSAERLDSRSNSQAFIYARLAALYEDLAEMNPAMNFYLAAVAAAPDAAWPRVLLGDTLRRRGETAAAEARYREAIEREPEQPEGYVRLADLLFATDRAGEASELSRKIPPLALARLEQALAAAGSPELARLLALAPSGAGVWQSDETMLSPLSGQGSGQTGGGGADANAVSPVLQPYQLGDQVDQVIDDYRQQIEQAAAENSDPALLARYYKDLGDLYVSANQNGPAEAAYRQSLGLDSWWPDTHLALAEVVGARGAYSETWQLVQNAVAMAPGAVEVQLAMAREQERRGDPAAALATFQATAAAHPGSAEATLALAQAYQARGQEPEATRVYTETIALHPGTAAAYSGLAEIRIGQARHDEARQLLHQALELDHLDVTTYIRLGDVDEETGNVEQALQWYGQAAELSPPGHPNRRTLVAALARHGHFDLAQRYATETLALRPDDVDMLLKLSQVYRATGRLDDALAMAQKAADLSSASAASGFPTDSAGASGSHNGSAAYVELAQVYAQQGRPDLAASAYLQAIELQPGEAENYLAASLLLANQARFDQARALLEQGQARVQDPDALTVALHDLLMARGEAPAARTVLDQALAARGPQPELLLALAAHQDVAGHPAEAQVQYDQAAALFPGNADVRVALADRQGRSGDETSALRGYRLAILEARTDPRPLLALARAQRQANRIDEATAVYSRTLALEPGLVDAYLDLGELYQQRGQPDKAASLYRRGLAVVPFAGELLGRYAALLADQGKPDEAAALVDEAAAQAPANDILLAQAGLHAKLGDTQRAIDALQMALGKEPASVEALLALGDIYAATHQAAAAQGAYSRVVDLYPGLVDGYVRLGGLAETQGKPAEAQALYERGLAAAPSSTDLLSRYAVLLTNEGKGETARQLVDEAVKLAPTADHLLARVQTYVEQGLTDEAAADLQAVLAKQPASLDALVALGDLNAERREAGKARQAFQKVVDLYPGLPIGYQRLGRLSADTEGQAERAGGYYEKGLAVAPYSDELMASYAVWLADRKETDQALQLADKAVALEASPQNLMARAGVYAAMGDVERAALDLETALAAEPASLDGWLALGDLYAAHGRPDDAQATYSRVVDLYPKLPAGYLRLGKLAEAQGNHKEAQRYMVLARQVQNLPEAGTGG